MSTNIKWLDKSRCVIQNTTPFSISGNSFTTTAFNADFFFDERPKPMVKLEWNYTHHMPDQATIECWEVRKHILGESTLVHHDFLGISWLSNTHCHSCQRYFSFFTFCQFSVIPPHGPCLVYLGKCDNRNCVLGEGYNPVYYKTARVTSQEDPPIPDVDNNLIFTYYK